jgi:hypothetical protein
MAKLKCLAKSNANPPVKTIYKEGYISVAENLILIEENFYEFLDADPEERPALLQKHAGRDPNNNKLVEHMLPDNTTSEIIDNTNCRIVAQKDARKKGNNKPSRVTMPMPDTRPLDFGYLAEYAQIIHNYYLSGTNADKDKAHKFLFGVMLLTRCR